MISPNNPFKENRQEYKLSDKNTKIGHVLNSNSTSGNTEVKNSLGSIMGTCPTTCKNDKGKIACYALKGNFLFDSTKKSQACQTWGWRFDFENITKDYEVQIAQLDATGKVYGTKFPLRIHASGDLFAQSECDFWLSMASKYKNVQFYMYTKRYDFIMNAIKSGVVAEKLDNFVLNVSVWGQYGREYIGVFDDFLETNIFEVVPKHYDRKSGEVFCPGYDKDTAKADHTKPCEICGLCWRKGGHHIVCVEHN